MSKQPSTLQALFAEMMRRRVFRVMAVYGVVAFMVLQIAELIFPMLLLPDWATRLVLGLVLVGFPIAIVIAWAFEATDEGIRRAEPAPPELIQQIVAQPASKRWPAGMLALLGMALLFWGGWWMGNRGADNPANILVPEVQAAGFKAIAALPFENVNGDDENRLIAMGVHDDLLTQMQRIAALRVTSRTSVREYEESDLSLREIAEELGVEYVLEGSVRSGGGRAVISVTLIDADTDEQLWTHRFDEEITPANLFDVQSEIAQRVVDALEAELTPQEVETLASITPPASSAAQQWYYRGLEAYERSSMDGVKPAIEAMQRAIELDSSYVAAWSELAVYLSRLTQSGEDRRAEALQAVERTEALAPGSVEANLARGYYEYYGLRNYLPAQEAFQAAVDKAPSDGDAAFALGLIQRRVGDWGPSSESLLRAIRVDPRNVRYMSAVTSNLEYMGALETADAVYERMLSLSPDNPLNRAAKTLNLVGLDGSTERANRLAAEIGLDASSYYESWVLYWLAMLDRDPQRARAALDQMDSGDVPLIDFLQLLWTSLTMHAAGDPAVAAMTDSARTVLDGLLLTDLESALWHGYLHAIAGRRDEAMQFLPVADSLVRLWEDHVDQTNRAIELVDAYGLIGETERGFSMLEEIIDRPAGELTATFMRLDPAYDPYRDDPRFDELLERRDAFEAEGEAWAEAREPWVP